MAAFDFPDSPMADQEYEANGVNYVYTGKVWNLKPFDTTNLEIMLDRKVDVAGDNMTGPLGLPFGDPERNQATSRAFVENFFPKEAPYSTPNSTTLYARQGGVYTPGDANYPLATDGQWVAITSFDDAPWTSEAYGRKDGYWVVVPEEAPREPANVYVRCDGVWVVGVTKERVDDLQAALEHEDRNKVDKGGDIMSGRLTLPMLLANPIQPGPPIEMPERADDAVHKAYVDKMAGVQEAPINARTWARRDENWVYIGIEDVQNLYQELLERVTEAPADGLAYVRINTGWEPVPKELADIPIMLDRKVDVAGDNMIGPLGLPSSPLPERNQAINRAFVENYYPQECPYVDPANPDIVYGRQGGVYTVGDANYPLATEGKWIPTVPEAPADGKTYGRQDYTWLEVAAKSYVDQMDRNKVDKGGDIMSGRLTLPMRLANPIQPGPPIEMPERDDDAVHKAYVDRMAGAPVRTELEPPVDALDGALWWDEDSAGLYLFYDDGSSKQWIQVNGIGQGGLAALSDSLPGADDMAYGIQNHQWIPVYQVTYGDVKEGFQPYDHNGWYMLDGRSVNTLGDLAKARAIALGFTTNLPNATNAVGMMTGGALGAISGSMTRSITIAQGNLPNVTLSAASAGAHTHSVPAAGLNTNSVGAHTHVTDSQGNHSHNVLYRRATGSNIGSDPGTNSDDQNHSNRSTDAAGAHTHTAASAGAHTHTVGGTATAASGGAHTHNVSLGGAGTAITLDITPLAMAVNKFVYLGPSFSR